MRHTCRSIFIVVLLLAVSAMGEDLRMACGNNLKTQVGTVDSSRFAYSIDLGRKIDGPMTRDPIGHWAYDQFWEPNSAVYHQSGNWGDDSART